MAIPQEAKLKEFQNQTQNQQDANKKPLVWDCGSTLYDSFELKSFERQLHSAINSRSLSMPHLADRRITLVNDNPPAPNPPAATKRVPSKISIRSLHKLLKSVFKPKQEVLRGFQERHVVYDKSGALTTIPKVPVEVEFGGGFSPEIRSLVGRTASERFVETSVSISCAS